MASIRSNFKTMLTGTILSQLIPIAFTPILTRLFTPDDFGIFAFYLSIVVIICAFNSGKYEQSIPLVSSDEQADNLFVGTLLIISSVTVILYIVTYFIWLQEITELNKIGNMIWLLPLSAALLSIYQALTYWHNRKSNFKKISKNLTFQSGINVIVSLIFGFLGSKSGLIYGDFFAKLFSSFNLFGKFEKIDWNLIKSSYIKYIDSPKYLVPATLLNAVSKQLPIIVFGLLFLPKLIGFLLVAQRVFQSPIGIVSTSLSQVILNRMSNEFKENKNCKSTYNKAFLFLSLLPIPAAVIIYLFIDKLVILFFGAAWAELGLLIKILFPFYYIYFISGTLNIVLIAAGKKRVNLLMQVIYFISTILLILLCYVYKLDAIQAVTVYSITSSISFLIALFFSYQVSRGNFHVESR